MKPSAQVLGSLPARDSERSDQRLDVDVVVVGAGFAGASTALALSERTSLRVLVVDGASIPGHHASGRNAAMARRVIENPILADLATRSVAEIRRRWPSLISHSGGLLLGSGPAIDQLAETASLTAGLGATVSRWSGRQAQKRLSCLRGVRSPAALFSPGCGVVDIHGLLQAYIKGAKSNGVQFRFGTELVGIEREAGAVGGVILESVGGLVSVRCGQVVNAAGFAMNRVAAMAQVTPLAATPYRRHLYVTAGMPLVGPDWPFVWDVSRGFYFRPEGDGLLMCACDETRWEPPLPDEPTTSAEQRERLAERFSKEVPGLAAARPKRHWAGLRVLTEDGRFAIGPDVELEGFLWVTALGGHGMTTSLAVGELAADLVAGQAVPQSTLKGLSPQRLR